ncbi:hypothetical protein M23134_07349 [Microscilla marina ATCC 23134]|uniref:Uncharacterized protein n=1 Tax=Microscilla marina ATCC 23134 TaxID=313606 RepID=A1ZEJ0_MICM2|nr:hypothetical protein M23134_05825 [Microscilla marina ATCC 23134]EAY30942.1 hypothetical protein M23134_07349 [Microscilla marina ATCC 23134]
MIKGDKNEAAYFSKDAGVVGFRLKPWQLIALMGWHKQKPDRKIYLYLPARISKT